MNERTSRLIDKYRETRIEGKCIDLIPFRLHDVENVIEIRNQGKNKYYLGQRYELTVEDQAEWYREYLTRHNDIYWCIYNKEKDFIGTIRIYDIDEENDLCNQGSFMIDEEQAEGAPYALEAEILSLDFAFNILKIGNVCNEDRIDNKVMNNLSKRLGFVLQKNTVKNGVTYNFYLLNLQDYKEHREKMQMIIDYWIER